MADNSSSARTSPTNHGKRSLSFGNTTRRVVATTRNPTYSFFTQQTKAFMIICLDRWRNRLPAGITQSSKEAWEEWRPLFA
ncbi:hypothetical protein F3P66_06445 [Agrobacterium fabrum]|uniref:Uncharacterized protein n=1 Tax=Agrobacterium fabrum (strain C58 / ATCC 33970) TaxID=176299 RepID=Q8UF34_AGRFC|nr:hypothetical protein Atu1566 [Agrobacterium fabrum str. C58]QKW98459.1 hypothetical protein GSF67_06525 [Agrobacterium sp. CGMCC 11546]QRM60614.1 hypothetical protein F3P66_06445 [Agrobacterium fabrum]TRB27122.1 hypothetical protein EXN51_21330 [Agrobacterium fabrum]